MKRGDIVRAELPRPAGSPGREQFGQRPAVVVQDELQSAGLETIVVVRLTSRLAAARFVGSFVVQPSPTNGLSVPSVVLTHQVRAIDKHRITGVIGRLGERETAILDAALRKLLRL